ncbi:TPA: hypothetical protein H2W01_004847 [Salmonella enterica]|nr:hypothetical protein [Salmonella enterica]
MKITIEHDFPDGIGKYLADAGEVLLVGRIRFMRKQRSTLNSIYLSLQCSLADMDKRIAIIQSISQPDSRSEENSYQAELAELLLLRERIGALYEEISHFLPLVSGSRLPFPECSPVSQGGVTEVRPSDQGV